MDQASELLIAFYNDAVDLELSEVKDPLQLKNYHAAFTTEK